jgi:DNA-binding transcriptional regulator YbjK
MTEAVSRDLIVDAAIALAEDIGWERLRLRLIADRLAVPLASVGGEFRDLDAIADAWFARGLGAMLAVPEPGFAALAPARRAEIVMLRWFQAMAPHRRVTIAMLREKLYPTHVHHWAPMIFNLSRLIQWVRDAAMLDDGASRRQREEVALTLLFLRALCAFAGDRDGDLPRTRASLSHGLAWIERRLAWWRGPNAAESPPAAHSAA